jgi:hypothetical protein
MKEFCKSCLSPQSLQAFDSILGGFYGVGRQTRVCTSHQTYMNQVLCSLVAGFLLTTQVFAAPKIEPLRKSELGISQSCRFFATKASQSVVLELKHWEANLRVDNRLLRLSVAEKKCSKNCVTARRNGVRVFQLSGPGVTATLTKNITCGRDAEVCGGLDEGSALLAVSTAAGRTVTSIWGEYCDM